MWSMYSGILGKHDIVHILWVVSYNLILVHNINLHFATESYLHISNPIVIAFVLKDFLSCRVWVLLYLVVLYRASTYIMGYCL